MWRPAHTRWFAMIAETILTVLVVMGLLASGSVFRMSGAFLGLLAPLPVVLLRLRHGWGPHLLVLGLVPAGLAGLASPGDGVAFLLEFGLPSVLLADGLRRATRLEVLVTGVAALLTAGGLGVLVLHSGQWLHPIAAVHRHVEALLVDAEAVAARLGLSAEAVSPLSASAAPIHEFLLMAFPGLLFVGRLLMASGYVLLVQGLMRRLPQWFLTLTPKPFRWELPDCLVWAFIAAGVSYLTGLPWLTPLGLNLLILLVGLYFLQGLSIVAYLFQRFHLPRFLAAFSVVLLLFQPLLTLLVAGVGLFDVWFAFRRLSVPKTPGRS